MVQALYDRIGVGYSDYRRPDPRIARRIAESLGPSASVLNVGAGSGSYEPADRSVVALEPSVEMVAQRSAHAGPAVRGVADHLPFRDGAFSAALAVLTMHHWPDPERGLREMRRVARDRVVILTWDPRHSGFWLVRDYFPELLRIDRAIFPPLEVVESIVGPARIEPLPIPWDCTDGFLGAYWRRPERYLDPRARRAISSFAKANDLDAGLAKLEADLADGSWHDRHGDLETCSTLDVGYRLVVADAS